MSIAPRKGRKAGSRQSPKGQTSAWKKNLLPRESAIGGPVEGMLLLGCQPIPRPGLGLVILADDIHADLVPPAFFLVIRAIADQILAVQLFPDLLDGIFQTVLAI